MCYKVTKRITTGSLTGMKVEEETTVPFIVGDTITPSAILGPGYVVEKVEPIARLASIMGKHCPSTHS